MILDFEDFETVRAELVEQGAEVTILAACNGNIDYTILAEFPNGEKWEIIAIEKS